MRSGGGLKGNSSWKWSMSINRIASFSTAPLLFKECVAISQFFFEFSAHFGGSHRYHWRWLPNAEKELFKCHFNWWFITLSAVILLWTLIKSTFKSCPLHIYAWRKRTNAREIAFSIVIELYVSEMTLPGTHFRGFDHEHLLETVPEMIVMNQKYN